jgi:hypothetical protein
MGGLAVTISRPWVYLIIQKNWEISLEQLRQAVQQIRKVVLPCELLEHIRL